METLNSKKCKMLYVLACILLMLICAGFTSPLYPHYTGLDSSMFLITAKGILNGKIPYIDLFDHKGPVFFWLESLGYACGGRIGVWMLECLLGIIDLLLLDRICSLFHAQRSTVIISTAAIFFYLFQHGNLTEELSMPLILLGVYVELKFLVTQQEKHSLWAAYLYGVILGLLAFIRLNNAVVLCALLLCIAIILMKHKQWINLMANIVMGLVGIATIAIPVCLYFYHYGALNDMLYATFLHNLIYAKNKTHDPILSSKFFYYMILILPGVYASVAYTKEWRAKKERVYAALLFATVLTYTMLIYTNIHAHYFMLGLPLFSLAVAASEKQHSVSDVWKILKERRYRLLKTSVLTVFLVFITVVYAGLSAYSACAPIYKTYLTDIANNEYTLIQKEIAVIPEEERDSVIGYDLLANYYYHADIIPCYKYYTLQKWMTTDKVDVNGDFLNNLRNNHPLWVIIPVDDDNEEIWKILKSRYQCEYSDDKYSCFRYSG